MKFDAKILENNAIVSVEQADGQVANGVEWLAVFSTLVFHSIHLAQLR